jgi:protein-disulfide isomerase
MPGEEDAAVPVSPRNPVWGSRVAPVTIVEFSDFQCPFCSRVEPTLDQLQTEYGPTKLRIVWKNNPLPFHQNAMPAAEAGAGVLALAGSDAFWKFHDAAFKHQSDLSRAAYETWATDAGVSPADLALLKAGLDGHRWQRDVDKDMDEGKAIGVTGTPTFFINGVEISGAQPFDTFKTTIDAELEKARAKMASGTLDSRVYFEMAGDNRKLALVAKRAADEDDTDAENEEARTVYKIPVGTSPIRGNINALVTIVEFGDFQCPFCKRVEPTLEGVRTKYGDKVRLVWKNEPLPFHSAAEPAAEASLEVRAERGDGAFWNVHDKLMDSSSLTSGSAPDIAAIVKVAVDAGASAGRVKKAIDDETYKKVIEADKSLAEDFQANGTPHFFINGVRLVGAQPPEKFDAIIDAQLARAQDLVAKGTKPADVYAALIRDGKEPPAPEKKDLPKGLPANDPVRGSAVAEVTIHEWADFQCPFCSRVEPTIAALMKRYGTRVKLVWHDMPLPFHPHAELAAEAAREAYAQKGASGFWALHDKMFAAPQKLERDDLDGYAKELGLNLGKWNAALDGSTHASEVDADKTAGSGIGFNGTPSFLVVGGKAASGYVVVGAQSNMAFEKAVDRASSDAPGAR